MNSENTSLQALAWQQAKEQRLMTDSSERIYSPSQSRELFGRQRIESTQQEGEWLKAQGYEPVKMGTYVSKEKGTYYYHKLGFEVATPEQAIEAMQLVRTLTEKGFFPEGTVWSTVQREPSDTRTTIVAEMPALEVVTPDTIALPQASRPEPWNRFTSMSDMSQVVGEPLSKVDYVFEASDRAETHIGKWVQSLGGEPGGDPMKGMNAFLGEAVNWGELGEFDNWGYDKKTNQFYPIDIEAIKPLIERGAELTKKLESLTS